MKFYRTSAIVALFLAVLFFAACNCAVYDSLKDCPQGVAFRFASKTPCGDVLKLDKLKQLHVQVYNSKGEFVQQFDEKDITVTPDYVLTIPFYAPGDKYSFVFWGMQNDKAYKLNRKYLELDTKFRAEDNTLMAIQLPALFYGAFHNYLNIDKSELGTQIDTLAVNMLPYSYPLNMRIQGLDPNKQYTVEIADTNIRFDWNGQVVDKPVTYVCDANKKGELQVVTLDVMRLVRPTNAIIRIKEKTTGQVVYTLPMEQALQDIEKDTHQEIKPDCVHRIDIDLTLKPDPENKDTYMAIAGRILNWNMVFREIIL